MYYPCPPFNYSMADLVRPLRLGTVIWFGSLEFMSLGSEYDMVVLTPRAPQTDNDVMHRQPKRRHNASKTTPMLLESRMARRSPPTSYDQLLAQAPWLGTYLA